MSKKKIGDRRDAKRIKLDGMHNLMYHIKPLRCDSDVYINQKIDVTELVKYIEGRRKTEKDLTYFHAISIAIAKTIYNKPHLNRFLIASKYYQRNDIILSFVAKTEFTDEASEYFINLKVDDDDTINNVKDKIVDKVKKVRESKTQNSADNVIEKVGRMPRMIRAFVIWLFKKLDNVDMLPKSLVQDDIYHSTVLLSNLGSIDCGSIYHNLTDFGTNSILLTMGKIHKEVVVNNKGETEIRDICDFGINLDERIADGFYFARAVKMFEYLLNNPKMLEEPVKTKVEVVKK